MANVSKLPFTEAVESLALLAAVRESIEVIEDMAIEVDDAIASVSSMTDSQILLSIPVIGVFSEMGESAQETFQHTSQQPSDAATPEEQPEQKGVQSDCVPASSNYPPFTISQFECGFSSAFATESSSEATALAFAVPSFHPSSVLAD